MRSRNGVRRMMVPRAVFVAGLAIIALLLGAVGYAIAAAVGHLWTDHQTLHALIEFVSKQLAAAQKGTTP